MDSAADTITRRVGILGGSFDPIHLGHLLIAQDAYEGLGLDQVVFMPAWQAPLKQSRPGATAEARLRMIQDAIANDPRFAVSDLELKRGGESFTIDTVRELHRIWPQTALFWIIGADQAEKLGQWRAIEALAQMVDFIVVARPGFALPSAAVAKGLRLHPVRSHQFEISSSEIRERIRAGRPVHLFLPARVYERIESESVYR